MFYKFTIAVLLLILILTEVNGQEHFPVSSDTANVPVDTLFSKIEEKYDVRIFWKDEFFDVRQLPLNLIDLSLEEILKQIESLAQSSWIKINGNAYVLMPVANQEVSRKDKSGFLEIGDPKEAGRYKTAKIFGTLLDGKSGEPLAGAVVSDKKRNIKVSSNGNGKFTMELPVGEHELEFSFFGYERSIQRIRLISDGKIKFEIFEKPVNIREVVIKAERSGSNISQISMGMIKMNSKSIKELPLTLGEADVLRSLTLLPGIQSVGEFGTGFNVRGGGADQNLILIEGTPIFNSSHLFGLESIVNPDAVSGLMLYKAGIPAKYGERASSVTSIQMGSNPEVFHMKGGIGLLSSRLSLETPVFKKSGNLMAGARSSYSNWLLHQLPDAELKNSKAGFFDMNMLLNVNVDKRNRVSLFGYYSGDKFNYNVIDNYGYGSILGSIRWSHTFSDKLSSKILLGYSGYNYKYTRNNPNLPSNAYRINSALHYNCLKYSFLWIPSRKISFDLGLDAIIYKSLPGDKIPFGENSEVKRVAGTQEKGLEGALYVSGTLELSEKLTNEIGLRYSGFTMLKSDRVYSGPEPRIALRYLLNSQSSLKLSYNRIYQYINLLSNTAVAFPSDIWKLSSPRIKPLLADQLALGYYRNFRQDAWETSLEVYFKTLSNIVEYRNGAQLLLNANIEDELLPASGYNYGIELYAKKNTGKLTGWISYTWSGSMRHTTGLINEDQIDRNQYFPSHYDKPHSLNLVVNSHITRRWRASLSFSYSTGRPVTLPSGKFKYGKDWLVRYSPRNAYRLPDYHRLDISISRDESLRIRKKMKGSWTISILNVYGRKNAFSSFYKKTEPAPSNDYQPYGLFNMYILGRPVPTLTYNFIF